MLRAFACVTALAAQIPFSIATASLDAAAQANLEVSLRASALLRHDVKRALRGDSALGGTHIAVSAREGVVTLAGVVGSEAQRRRAIEVAAGVRGVRAVEDALEVEPPGRITPASEPAPGEAVRRERRRRVARAAPRPARAARKGSPGR